MLDFLNDLEESLNALPQKFALADASSSTVVDTELVRAAVLMPLLVTDDRIDIVLTKRADHLSSHPGQISFPGGRVEPVDLTPADTALRETLEEIGVAPERVRLIGALDELTTPSGYRIYPVVGLIGFVDQYILDSSEVADVLHLPLDFAVDRKNHRLRRRAFQGKQIEYHEISYQGWEIWGATARMLIDFTGKVERCRSSRLLLSFK